MLSVCIFIVIVVVKKNRMFDTQWLPFLRSGFFFILDNMALGSASVAFQVKRVASAPPTNATHVYMHKMFCQIKN